MDKQKRQYKQLSSQTIVILWALIQSFGWGMIYLMLVNMNRGSMPDPFMFGFVGLLSGAIMGALQHTLIDRGSDVQLRHWLVLTIVGTTAGFVALAIEDLWFDSPYLYLMPVFILPAIFQWFSIRRYTRAGSLWIVANGIASLVFVMFLLMIEGQGYDFLSAVIPALLQGVASGFAMVWLLRKLPKPKQDLTHEKAKVSYDSKVKVS